jgi:hypothetical protein
MAGGANASRSTTLRGLRPWHVRTLLGREPGDLVADHRREPSGPHREGIASKPMMYGDEKSDRCVVPRKSPNKAERSAAEGMEGRHLVEGRPVGKTRTGHRAGFRVPPVAWSGCAIAWVAQTPIGTTADLRQEPGAGIPHAGICAGGVQ